MSRQTLSPIGRVAYPSIATARKRNETAKPRFSTTLVFDEDVNLKAFKAKIKAVVDEEYRGKNLPNNFRWPWRPGTDRVDDNGNQIEGFKKTDTFCEFWRYEEHGRVPCVDAQRNDLLASDIYAGMTARVAFRPFCYSVDGNKGVSLGLEAFQKAADGTPVGAAPVDPQKAFDDIEEEDADLASLLD